MHKRRTNSSTVLPMSDNGQNGKPFSPAIAFGSPDNTIKSPRQYTTPNNYAGKPRQSPQVPSKLRKKSLFSFQLPQWLYLLLIFVISCFMLMYRFQVWKVNKQLLKVQTRMSRREGRERDRSDVDDTSITKLTRQLENANRKLERRENELEAIKLFNEKLGNDKQELIKELEDHHLHHHDGEEYVPVAKDTPETLEKLNKFEKREEHLYARIGSLQEKIQRESIREVKERFGDGPHYVEFNMRLPEQVITEDLPISPTPKIVIQMASVDQMPHSVHLFLEQVHHNLWNDCAIVINALHIMQIGPHSLTDVRDRLKPFRDMKLDKVAFQEYNETFPHEKYTLGYAGRPGGPDFYINKVNNTQNHGPGGQEHHALDEEADPCFAKVVRGFDVIDFISTMQTRGAQSILAHEVVIDNLRLLDDFRLD